MEEVKRYTIDFSDGETAEGVLYTDYAALKVKLEIAQQLKVAIEDDANRTEAALKARCEELTLKGKEREQIAVDDAELIQTLRAQLEAAKLLQESTAAELTHEEEGRRSWQKLAVLASERAMAAERQLEAAKLRLGYYAEGHDLAASAPVCVCGHSKADHAEKHGWECSEECACLKYTPAPAPVKHYINGPFAAGTPAPAYDPKPDWRCKACEETGMRHCSEPERCGNMKPPAPAKERCALCGISRENHDVIINGQPHPYAPACKTCGGYQEVKKMVGPTFEQWQPCPDCAKET